MFTIWLQLKVSQLHNGHSWKKLSREPNSANKVFEHESPLSGTLSTPSLPLPASLLKALSLLSPEILAGAAPSPGNQPEPGDKADLWFHA